MSMLTVHLLGEFQASYDERIVSGFDVRKVQELFCYLLLHRGRSHAREMLSSLLWDDTGPTQSRANLRKTLWQLQAALDGNAVDSPAPLLIDADRVQINPRAELWLDVAVLEQAHMLTKGHPGELLCSEHAQAVEHALRLYQGELLDGCYQEWCLFERERLQLIYMSLLDKMLVYCTARADYEDGIDYGSRLLRCDRAHEQTHRRLMLIYGLAGDRTAALRQYERCAAALDEELGVGPSEITTQLLQQLKANRLDTVALDGASRSLDTAASSLPSVLDHLQRLALTVGALQAQLQRHMDRVEQLMRGPR